jgi:hypothetical protein
METWTLVRWSLLAAGGLGAVYGLHRLALMMETRGWIYYLNKKPRGGMVGSFVALQKAIEPRAQHVLQVTRVNHEAGEEGASGRNRDTTGPEAPGA